MTPRAALFALLVAVGLGAAVTLGYLLGTSNKSDASMKANVPTSTVVAAAAVEEGNAALKSLPSEEQTSRAFEAAFGQSNSAERKVDVGDGQIETVTYEPVRLFWTDYGPVLISAGSWPVGMAGVGYMAIHYLEPEGSSFRVKGEWLTAIPGSGNGMPPYEPMYSRKFSRLPVVYTESGFTHMGQTCGYFELTELRPDGPKLLGSFLKYRVSDDGPEVEGKFTEITHRGFELEFTREGNQESNAKFKRAGDKYVFAGSGEEPEC